MYLGIRDLSFLNFNTVKVPYLNLKKSKYV